MRIHVRRAAAMVVTVLVTAGCGVGLMPLDDGSAYLPPAEERLAVNDYLRQACAGFAEDDIDIKTLLLAAEDARLSGASKGDAYDAINWAAMTPLDQSSMECWRCGYAAVEQVYGP